MVPVEAWGHPSIFRIFDIELFLPKGNAGIKMEQRLKERPSSDQPNVGFIPWMGIKPYIITGAMLSLQAGA